MGKRRLITTITAVTSVGLFAFSLPVSAAVPIPAGARVQALRVGRTMPLPKGATLVGALAPSSRLEATVSLEPSDAAGLASYATAVSTPGDALFHHYLSVGQFAEAFGPSASTVDRVHGVLADAGLSPDAVSPNQLSIHIHGTAAQFSRLFATSFQQYRVADGRLAYTNTVAPLIPASIVGAVQSVVGLSNLTLAHSSVAKAKAAHAQSSPHVVTGGPQPCSAASKEAAASGSFTADQLASAYSLSSLYKAGDFGAGQTIAMYELEGNLPSDIAAFQSCYGTSAPVSYRKVGSGVPLEAGGEATFDIENAIEVAPKARELVYQGPNSGSGGIDTYTAIISDNIAQVVSVSWGNCEPDAQATDAENTLFQEAATQGQSILDAAGDDGAEDCGKGNPALAVDDPAGQPFITAVGGTKLTNLGPAPTESVWNDQVTKNGAGGGGISELYSMPDYQRNSAAGLHVLNARSSGKPCGEDPGSYCRQVPDVSLVADPDTGYVIYVAGKWTASGGTSGAAPYWAGFLALVNASTGCGGSNNVGFVNPALYKIAGSSYAANFNDITKGNNDYTRTHDGLFPAGAGYDMASGLGTLIGGHLATALCTPTRSAVVPTTDGLGSRHQQGAATATLTTTTAGDLIVAFVSGGGSAPLKATVSGAGLTWSLARRSNTQGGTAEIWTARASKVLNQAQITSSLAGSTADQLLTVVAFKGASGIGASASGSGAASNAAVNVITKGAPGLVVGVGNDPAAALARTAGANQRYLAQATGPSASYWVQQRLVAARTAGTFVGLDQAAPGREKWNMTVLEID